MGVVREGGATGACECTETRLRILSPKQFPLSGDALRFKNSRKKCSPRGWLLNFPLAELSSNTPPKLGHSPPNVRKGLGRSHWTANQQLPHSHLPNPPMNRSNPTLRPRNHRLRYLGRSPTQSFRNFQVSLHWTSPPQTRGHVQTGQAPGLPKTPRVQSNVRRGS